MTPAELARLRGPGSPAVAASKRAICVSVKSQPGSSARAKWLIRVIEDTRPLSRRRRWKLRTSEGEMPARCMPVSIFSHTFRREQPIGARSIMLICAS